MNIAVVGITGMVGRTMLKVLEERRFPVTQLIPVASERSRGGEIHFMNRKYTIVTPEEALEKEIDIALFSAGGDVSKNWAPLFAKRGIRVIDNSSAWRMDGTKKLIVPEINAGTLKTEDFIIANPNCSTIQMVMALAPLHRKFGVKRVVVSTYQSVTGTGYKAVQQLEDERKGAVSERVYPHPIDKNALPHCDDFTENGYTKEEMKMVNETRKIFGDPSLLIAPTAVRVPVEGGHGESVNVTFSRAFEMEGIYAALEQAPGVRIWDDPKSNTYPTPLYAHGKDEVFVGRLRRDISADNTLAMWIVADNLRKGAATNAVQIAEYLKEHIM